MALAGFLASTKDLDGALKELDAALHLDPQNVRAYTLKADVQLARNDASGAEETLKSLKARAPSQPAGYYRLGSLYESQKNPDKAVAEYEAALRVAPGAIEPLTAIANVLVSQGKTESAAARVQRAIETGPANPLAYSLLANMLVRQNKQAEAEAALRKAIQIDPTASGPYVGLATLYLTRGDRNAAIGALQQGLAADPGDPWLSVNLAQTYQQGRDDAKALAEYEAILKRNPRFDVAANNAAALLAETGDRAKFERALQLAKRFEKSSNPTFLDTLGWVYYRLDRNAEALPLLQRAVAGAPKEPSFQFHLGMALQKQGDVKAAKMHLQEAVAAKRDFRGIEEARENLARM